MFAYKLVSQDYKTYNNTAWEIGKTIIATGHFDKLCSDDLLHFYTDKHIAVIMNPVHANIQKPKLIQISCSKIIATDGLKYGCKRQTMIKELKLPVIELHTKIAFAILCALKVYKKPGYVKWAKNWLSGIDRTEKTAYAAYAAAVNAAANAAYAAANAAYAAYAVNAAAVNAAAAQQNKNINFSQLFKQAQLISR